ncbi:DegT/DnrJ/EryC1/StrS family aminotransferase [Thermodesulforhabdus norvegica]|uniref:dTDP-4-amino-4,6-dideoxygalactose transaminase n=1 Tax=Thermodesulforhabdus norvegica TaxID=39841 RepID=A0A1I4UYP0_9BACT|nr:DegT/DnrJ/EryC1/StrS family aminotransferase [Thermodesulforhabdus norvegica]SFM94094.1 dTDP-4-amino-4,6-dideoxygalactose transaminase [Thermodesulforhabdus norvegica]
MAKRSSPSDKPVRRKENFLVFGAPCLGEEEISEVVDSMKKRWIGTGPKVGMFEEEFRLLKGRKHAIAVNSCTAALHLAILALGIRPGDEVITTPMTFCATVNAIIHAGGVPVLADCKKDTMNIDPEEIEKKISARTKALLIVHFAGRPCEMDAIMELAHSYDLHVIEDCAHAIETEYHGRQAGCFGTIGCFSFYVTKNITTGEGGMVITDDDRVAERIKMLALHGMSKDAWRRFSDTGYRHYEVIHAGFKYNMTDMQAAIGLHQLKKLEQFRKRREEIWKFYNEAFKDLPVFLPPDPEPDTVHAYHLYTPLIDVDRLGKSRDWVLDAMTRENIGVGVHYLPIHYHPYYRKALNVKPGDFPAAEWIGDRTISLPLSGCLTDEEVEDVVRAFRKVLGA